MPIAMSESMSRRFWALVAEIVEECTMWYRRRLITKAVEQTATLQPSSKRVAARMLKQSILYDRSSPRSHSLMSHHTGA